MIPFKALVSLFTLSKATGFTLHFGYLFEAILILLTSNNCISVSFLCKYVLTIYIVVNIYFMFYQSMVDC
jgi:hypothetical protein